MRINYISDSGKPKQLTRVAYGLDNAKNLEHKLNHTVKNKGEIPTKKMTIDELFQEFIAVKKIEIKEISIEKITNTYNYYVKPIFKNHRIDRINVVMLQDWKLEQEKKKLSLGTNQSAFKTIRALLNYAIQMEYIQKNPFDKISNFVDKSTIKKKIEFYTIEEFKTFINKAREIAEEREKTERNLFEWDFYVFFNIAFYTGLRKGEIHALKWSDIEDDYLTVERTMVQRLKGEDKETLPKSKSSIRTLQMPIPLMKVLEEHKQRQQKLHNFTEDFRICKVRNGTICRKNELYSDLASLKTIRIHDFRHSHVSILANENINIQEIARRLGHARIEMTWNTYSHLYPREQERAVNILNRLV